MFKLLLILFFYQLSFYLVVSTTYFSNFLIVQSKILVINKKYLYVWKCMF